MNRPPQSGDESRLTGGFRSLATPRTPWLLASVGLALSLLGPGVARADWPMYRGPEGNGISRERIRTDWNANPPRLLWRKPLTNGLSSVSIGGGRVFTQVRRGSALGGSEVCVALDAATGNFIWTKPVDVARYPGGGVGNDDGPRSTPALRGDRLFVLGSYLQMHCLDVATGNTIWSKDLQAQFGGEVIPWQNAASPLLEGDLILLNCNAPSGSLLALRQSDGSVVWRRHADAMTHATPVPVTIEGVRQVIFITQPGVVAVVPETGDVLWRFAYPYPNDLSTAASPTYEQGRVFCSAAYNIGSAAAAIARRGNSWTATSLWNRRPSRMIHWSTPVVVDGYAYGLFEGGSISLRCMDIRTGTDRWTEPGLGRGATLVVDGKLLVLAESGEAVLVEFDPSAYRELGRFTAVDGRIWNSPGISEGILYVRGTSELAAYEIGVPPPPALQLVARLEPSGDQLLIEVSNLDGSPIEPLRAARITLVQSDAAEVPVASWSGSGLSLTWSAGRLQAVTDFPAEAVPRYFAARED